MEDPQVSTLPLTSNLRVVRLTFSPTLSSCMTDRPTASHGRAAACFSQRRKTKITVGIGPLCRKYHSWDQTLAHLLRTGEFGCYRRLLWNTPGMYASLNASSLVRPRYVSEWNARSNRLRSLQCPRKWLLSFGRGYCRFLEIAEYLSTSPS